MAIPDLAQAVLGKLEDKATGEGWHEEEHTVHEACKGRIHHGLPVGKEGVSCLLQ